MFSSRFADSEKSCVSQAIVYADKKVKNDTT
jgi:hypothetical protein